MLPKRRAFVARRFHVGVADSSQRQAGTTMKDIVDSVQRVTAIIGEIMVATQEQTLGIEQTNQAIGQMDQVTQQNASLVEEAAAASETMQHQAAQLAEVVSVFKVEDGAPRLAAPKAAARLIAA